MFFAILRKRRRLEKGGVFVPRQGNRGVLSASGADRECRRKRGREGGPAAAFGAGDRGAPRGVRTPLDADRHGQQAVCFQQLGQHRPRAGGHAGARASLFVRAPPDRADGRPGRKSGRARAHRRLPGLCGGACSARAADRAFPRPRRRGLLPGARPGPGGEADRAGRLRRERGAPGRL